MTTMEMTAETKSNSTVNSTVLWVTYVNIVLYALSYQLQKPVEPFLIKRLSEETGDSESVNQTYGNLQSFFMTIQTIGSPLVGILLDRVGIRYTSAIVFLASALCYTILAVSYDLPTLFLSKIPTVFQAAFLVAQATAATSTGKNHAARAAALGRMTTAYTVGATLGPTIGGFLADQGDFYIGAKLAVVGSLVSVVLSLLYLPNETHSDDAKFYEVDSEVATDVKKNKSFFDSIHHSGQLALRSSLWPLLMVKVLGGVVASLHSTAMPLVFTQQLKLEPSQLGMIMSSSMMAVAIFGAVGMAPLTKLLGPPRMTHVGLLGRALLGCLMAAIVTVAVRRTNVFFREIVAIAIVHALSSHVLATGLTTQTTGAVTKNEQGSLLGLEHSLYSLARIGGPKIATSLLGMDSGLWSIEITCAISDVLLVIFLIYAVSQNPSKSKGP